MRRLTKIFFDGDAPFTLLFAPIYYLAELVASGFQAGRVRTRGNAFEQVYKADDFDLEIEISGTTKGPRKKPDKVDAIAAFWNGEPLVRMFALGLAFGALTRTMKVASGTEFAKALDRLTEIFTKGSRTVGTDADEEARGSKARDVSKLKGGDDDAYASAGKDQHDGGGGTDTYRGSDLNAPLVADLQKGFARKKGAGRDKLDNFENVIGSDKRDKLKGDDEVNEISGLGGADVVLGGDGNDTLHGDDGKDLLKGGDGGDLIYGGDGKDRLLGGKGADTMFGGAKDDVLDGGPGLDAMFGGEGADTFVLDGRPDPQGPDQVHDFDAAQGDRLRLTGDASEYDVVVTAFGDTEIRRDGETVGVLVDTEAPDALQDALFQ